jgi:hypothetical protein
MYPFYLLALISVIVISCRDDDDAHSDGTRSSGDTDVDGDDGDTPIDGTFSGDGTYYSATGDGACMLGTTWMWRPSTAPSGQAVHGAARLRGGERPQRERPSKNRRFVSRMPPG